MKKLMTIMLGLSLAIGASALMAQDKGAPKAEETKEKGKGKGKGKGDGKAPEGDTKGGEKGKAPEGKGK
jgi:hypothetical protein